MPSAPPPQSNLQPQREDKNLSGGAVGGIVVGVLGAIGLVALGFFLFRRNKRSSNDVERPRNGHFSPVRKLIPGRQASVLSRTGLLSSEPAPPTTEKPDLFVNTSQPQLGRRGSMGASAAMGESAPHSASTATAERRNSRLMFVDSRLNPNALMMGDNGSQTSIGTMQDNRDYTRPLGVTNPDPPENRTQFHQLRRRSAVFGHGENGDDGRGSGCFIRGALPPPAEHLPRTSTQATVAGPSASSFVSVQTAQAGSLPRGDGTYEVSVEMKANEVQGTRQNDISEGAELSEGSPKLPNINEEEEVEESVPQGTQGAELSSAEGIERANTSDPSETTIRQSRPLNGASEAQAGAPTKHYGPEQPKAPARATPELEEFDADDESSP
ncbi:MAG: hypothetical protein Q9165_000366 [Trypethelium subeluteriae]